MRRLTALLAAGVLAATLAITSSSSNDPASAFPNAKWRIFIKCEFSHSAHDDPIVYPGQPGAAHEHGFFGNTRTNWSANARRMRALPRATTCHATADTAAYWTPTAINTATGEKLDPVKMNVYMVNPNNDPDMKGFPKGWRAVSDDIQVLGLGDDPAAGAGVRVWFRRQCWDGVTRRMPSADAYRAATREEIGLDCPAGFPVLLPKMHFNARFGIPSMDGYEPSSVSQSNGVGWHGDFWNTWQQPWENALVRACLNPPPIPQPVGCAEISDKNIDQKLTERGVTPPPADPA